MNAIYLTLPAAALGLWLMWLCLHRKRPGRSVSPWVLTPPEMPQEQLRAVCVPPDMVLGQRRLTVQLWLPFQQVEPERFRQQPGALMLSAAMALTADQLPALNGWQHSDWLTLLHISAGNFQKKHPVIDQARVDGFPGVVVLDGLERRAYFAGGPALAAACTHVMDGSPRPMGRRDAARLDALPPDSWCFATCTVGREGPGPLSYLGAVRPVELLQAAPEAVAAVEALRRRGIETCLLPLSDPPLPGEQDRLRAACALGYQVLDPEMAPGAVAVRPDRASDGNFAAPVLAMLTRHTARQAALVRGMCLAAAVALAGLALGCPAITLLMALCALPLGLWLAEDPRLDRPAAFQRTWAVAALAAAFVLPLVLRLAGLRLMEHTQALAFAAGCTLGMSGAGLWRYLLPREGQRPVAWLAVLPLAVTALVWLWWAWAGTLVGVTAGLACGAALCWALEQR